MYELIQNSWYLNYLYSNRVYFWSRKWSVFLPIARVQQWCWWWMVIGTTVFVPMSSRHVWISLWTGSLVQKFGNGRNWFLINGGLGAAFLRFRRGWWWWRKRRSLQTSRWMRRWSVRSDLLVCRWIHGGHLSAWYCKTKFRPKFFVRPK